MYEDSSRLATAIYNVCLLLSEFSSAVTMPHRLIDFYLNWKFGLRWLTVLLTKVMEFSYVFALGIALLGIGHNKIISDDSKKAWSQFCECAVCGVWFREKDAIRTEYKVSHFWV